MQTFTHHARRTGEANLAVLAARTVRVPIRVFRVIRDHGKRQIARACLLSTHIVRVVNDSSLSHLTEGFAMKQKLTLCLVAGFSLLTTQTLFGQGVWLNNGSDFHDPDNWSGTGTFPRTFDAEKTVNPIVTQHTEIGRMSFTAGAFGYTLSNQNDAVLTLTFGSSSTTTFTIDVASGGINTISADLALTSSANKLISVADGSALVISGDITASGNAVQKRSTGVLTLSGSNTFADGLNLSHGAQGTLSSDTLNLNSSGAAGTGVFRFGHNNADRVFLDNTSGSAITSTATDVRLTTGHATFIGTHDLHFAHSTLTLDGGNRTLKTDGGILSFNGLGTDVVDTARNFTKNGVGTVRITGASNYGGVTQIQGGVLAFLGTSSLSAANLQLRGGVLGLGPTMGDFTRSLGTGAGEVQFLGGGGFTAEGGFAAYGGNRIVNIGNAAAEYTWSDSNFITGTLMLGADDADATVDVVNPLVLTSASGGQNREFRVANGSAEVDAVLSGRLSGAGGLERSFRKTGDGTLRLTADNTYLGVINVEAGTLLVDGDQTAATGNMTVQVGATLGGSGTVGGAVNVSGILRPGSPTGTLTLKGNLTLQDGARLAFELGTVSGKVAFLGASQTIANVGDVSCNVVQGVGFDPSGTYVLLDWTDATSPTVTGLDANDFVLENEDLQATFEVVGSTLVAKLKPLFNPATVILLR